MQSEQESTAQDAIPTGTSLRADYEGLAKTAHDESERHRKRMHRLYRWAGWITPVRGLAASIATGGLGALLAAILGANSLTYLIICAVGAGVLAIVGSLSLKAAAPRAERRSDRLAALAREIDADAKGLPLLDYETANEKFKKLNDRLENIGPEH